VLYRFAAWTRATPAHKLTIRHKVEEIVMFERYTEKARRVIFFARYEASQFGSPFIETEHLLLGIIREDKRLTNRFRSQAAVASIRKQVENHTTAREKTSTSVDLPLTNESKQVLTYAKEEADELAHRHIGTEHLFLGLLREEKCFAAQILGEQGIRLAEAREDIGRSPSELVTGEPKQNTGTLAEISAYVTELTEQTQPLIGREEEVGRLVALLCRYHRVNPVLVGERGVGKKTIVGGLARRIADGAVPESLAKKSIVALDLPPLRILDKNSLERLDGALVTAAEEGKIFFVNLMHDQPDGISPTAWIRVAELLYRPVVAGKIQCISTASPATFGTLQAERHWLAQYFEPFQVSPASDESAMKVLQGIKGVYEGFHNVSYSDESIMHAISCARRCIKRGGLHGTAVDVIDEAGAAAQLRQGTLPEEVVAAQKLKRLAAQRMENCIANHEFEKARFYSGEERKEHDNLEQLRKKYKLDENPAWNIRLEEIETAVSKLTGMPIAAIRQSQ
jgi:ATP-dependent Clp protease ATP-binding subunit ClpC